MSLELTARKRRGSRLWIERSRWATLEGLTNSQALGALDLVPKDVVPQAHVISTPADHSRPCQTVEEVAGGSAPFCPGDAPSHPARERSQERLKIRAAPRAQHQVQVRTHVGKVVDADLEPTSHATQHVTHGTVVLA